VISSRSQGYGPELQDHAANGDPQFLQGALPPHGARNPRAPGIPLEQCFPAEEVVDGIVPGLWREAVVEKDAKGRPRVNRITYEICILEALRDKRRCKEVWVVGANRYRNPDEDPIVSTSTPTAKAQSPLPSAGCWVSLSPLPVDADTAVARHAGVGDLKRLSRVGDRR
jgi:hypothetical protein